VDKAGLLTSITRSEDMRNSREAAFWSSTVVNGYGRLKHYCKWLVEETSSGYYHFLASFRLTCVITACGLCTHSSYKIVVNSSSNKWMRFHLKGIVCGLPLGFRTLVSIFQKVSGTKFSRLLNWSTTNPRVGNWQEPIVRKWSVALVRLWPGTVA